MASNQKTIFAYDDFSFENSLLMGMKIKSMTSMHFVFHEIKF